MVEAVVCDTFCRRGWKGHRDGTHTDYISNDILRNQAQL